MPNTMLKGCSILVVEEHPFVVHCLEMLLKGAGAEVHTAGCASEALHLIDRTRLSAAVLHDGRSAKGHQRIVQRLVRDGLPCVLCNDRGDLHQEQRGASILIKPVLGAQLVDTLSSLVRVRRETMRTQVHAESIQPAT